MKEKRENQQHKLLHAACELVAENGVSALRTRDIAAKAGVCVGTLHYCFATKEELLTALYAHIRSEFRRYTDHLELDGQPLRETLDGQVRLRLFLLQSQQMVHLAWRAFMRESSTNPLVREIMRSHYEEQRVRFEQILERGQADGSLPIVPGASNSVMAAVIVSLFEGLNLQWRLDPSAIDLYEYVRSLYRFLGCPMPAEFDILKRDNEFNENER